MFCQAAAQLLEGCIDLFQRGATAEDKASALPKLAGRVWETCEAVKKAPTSNQVAVGRGLALLAATVKDTLREMGEMKETVSGQDGGEGGSEAATEEGGQKGKKEETTIGRDQGESGREGATLEGGEEGKKKETTIGQNGGESGKEGARLEGGENGATHSQGQAEGRAEGGESARARVGGLAKEGREPTSGEASASEARASGASLSVQAGKTEGQHGEATRVLGDSLRRMHLGESANQTSAIFSQPNGKAGPEVPRGTRDSSGEEGKAGMLLNEGKAVGSSEEGRGGNQSQSRGETKASQGGAKAGTIQDGVEATASREDTASPETVPKREQSQDGGTAEAPHEGAKTNDSPRGVQATRSDERGEMRLPDDLGDMAEILDYNPEFDAEDMELVRATVLVAEGVLALLKELLYVVAKWAPPADWSKDAALNVLEMLHGDCR